MVGLIGDAWQHVIYEQYCRPCSCGQPVCPMCQQHYWEDCDCPKPGLDTLYCYMDVSGVLFARKRVN